MRLALIEGQISIGSTRIILCLQLFSEGQGLQSQGHRPVHPAEQEERINRGSLHPVCLGRDALRRMRDHAVPKQQEEGLPRGQVLAPSFVSLHSYAVITGLCVQLLSGREFLPQHLVQNRQEQDRGRCRLPPRGQRRPVRAQRFCLACAKSSKENIIRDDLGETV